MFYGDSKILRVDLKFWVGEGDVIIKILGVVWKDFEVNINDFWGDFNDL